ncbi:MAG: hypothetical protein ACR2OI_03290 [Acidimicrobiia bacterium]
MLHPALEDAIESLRTTWRHYDDLTRRRAEHRIRASARASLDTERLRVYRLRRGLHPEARELEEVVVSSQCPSLGAPVFIRRADMLDESGSFACPCGAVVEGMAAGR